MGDMGVHMVDMIRSQIGEFRRVQAECVAQLAQMIEPRGECQQINSRPQFAAVDQGIPRIADRGLSRVG